MNNKKKHNEEENSNIAKARYVTGNARVLDAGVNQSGYKKSAEQESTAPKQPKNSGWTKGENGPVFVTNGRRITPGSILPSKAAYPGVYGIKPNDYAGMMGSIDRHNALVEKGAPKAAGMDAVESEEGKRFLSKWFPEKASAGTLPTEDEVRAKYAQLDPWQQDSYWMEWMANEAALSPLMLQDVETDAYNRELKEAQAARDEALKVLGADAAKYATGRTADYFERYGKEYRAMDGSKDAEPYLRYGDMGGIDLETAKKYSASPYIGRGQGYDLQRWAVTSPEQRDHYELLKRVYGDEAADEYLNSIQSELNEKLAQEETTLAQQYANEHPFMSSLESIITAPVRGAVALEGMAQEYLTGKQMDDYDPRMNMTRRTEAIRGQTAQNIGGGVGGFLYQTLMSIGDNVANMALMGGLGSAAVGTLMFGSSFASAFNDVVDRTGDHDQAMIAGVLSGAAEMVFEKYSIEGFFDMLQKGTGGKAVLDVLRQMGVEASEEGATAIANEISDRLVMGEKSNYETKVTNLMMQGMQEDEARKAANMEAAKEIGLSMAGGAVSGGVMGGIGQGINYISGGREQNAQPVQEAQQTAEVAEPERVEREITGKRPEQSNEVSQQEAQAAQPDKQEGQTKKPAQVPSKAEKGKTFRVEREVTVRRNGMAQGMNITGVEDVNGGNVFLRAKNEDGETEIVSAADVEFADPVQQELMNYKGLGRMDAVGVRGYLEGYDESIATPEQYAQAFESAYQDGKAGLDYVRMLQDERTLARRYLTEGARQIAWAAGDRANLMNARSTKYQKIVTETLNKAAGGKIRFVDEKIDGNGYYDRNTGEIVISKNADKGAYAYIAVHELGHKLKAENAEAWGSFQTLVEDALLVNGVDIDERIAQTKKLYSERGQELTTDEALEEVICNSAASILQDEKIVKDMIAKDRSLMERVADFLREFVDRLASAIAKAGEGMSKLEGWAQLDALKADHENLQKIYKSLMDGLEGTKENRAADEGGAVKMSVKESGYDFSKPFVEQVKDWLNGDFPEKDTFLIGRTPEVLQKIGFDDLPVSMDQKHVNHVVGKVKNPDHDLGMDFLEKLPELIEKPILIFENEAAADEGVTMVLAYKNKNAGDRPVIGVVNVKRGGSMHGMSLDANKLLTAHSRADLTEKIENAVEKELNGETAVYYLDKKSSRSFFEPGQSQVLDALKKEGYIHSIQENGSPVNAKGIKQTDTQQFRRWFKNSKIRNADGSPTIMYRGGGEEINIFDRKKSKASNLYGRGFYFTDSETHAKQYGEARSYYLSVKNPLSSKNNAKKITKEQMRAFLEAVAEDEDYGLENYGYGATVESVLEGLNDKNDFDALQDVNATAVGDFVAAIELFNDVNGTEYDGIITDTETVVFDSRQIKSATNNVGTFDPQTPDIRYSIRETSEAVQEELQQTAAAFEQVRHAHRITPAEADGLAGRMLKEANSAYDRATLASEIAQIYDYIENAETIDMDYVDDMQTALMARVMDKSKVLDEEHEQTVDPIREYLKGTRIRLTDTQRKEAANISGSYGAYRREVMGRVKLVSMGGTEMDVAWEELNDINPEWFPEDTPEGDMPGMLLEVVDALKPVYMTGMNTEETASWMAGKLNEAYLSLPAVKAAARSQKGFAGSVRDMRMAMKRFEETSAEDFDEALRLLEESRRKAKDETDREAISELRRQYDEWKAKDADKREERFQLELKRAKDKIRADDLAMRRVYMQVIQKGYERQRMKDSADRRERELVNKQRARTEATVRTLLNWMDKPTDAKHVPADLEEPLKDVLAALDFGGKNTKVATELSQRLEKLAEVIEGAQEKEEESRENFLPADQQMVDELKNVAMMIGGDTGGRGVYELKGAELKELNKWLGVVKHVLVNAGKMRGSNFDQDVKQIAAESIFEINKKKPMKKKSWMTKQWGNLFGVDMMDSFTFFDRLGKTSTRVFQGLRDGFDVMSGMIREADVATKKTIKDAGIESKELEKLTGPKAKKIKYKMENSDYELELTKANIMEIYALYRRGEQARGHMMEKTKMLIRGKVKTVYGEGIIIRGDEDQTPHALSEKDAANLFGMLTEKEKKLTEGLQKFLSTVCAKWGNETSLKLLGYEKYGEENYWPISTDPNTRGTTRLEENYEANIRAITSQGMTKQTEKGARNAIVIGDIFDDYTRHISNMAAYSAYAVPLTDFIRWYNTQGVNRAIINTMGVKGKEYINNLLMAVNGKALRIPKTGLERAVGVMNRNAKTAAVGANLQVAIQQPTSYARAATYINERFLIKAAGMKLKKKDVPLVNRYCGIAQWKRYGFYETNVGPNLRQIIIGDQTPMEWMREKSMWMASVGDDWTINHLWIACELETQKLMPELAKGSEEYYRHVGKRLSEIIDRTQVVDSPFHRSQMMRSKSFLAQTLTNFMSEPTKTFNMLTGAFYEWTQNRKNPAAKKKLAKTVAVFAFSAVLTAAAKSVTGAWRDEDEKEFEEKYMHALIGDYEEAETWWDYATGFLFSNVGSGLNPLGMMPFTNEILSSLQGYDSVRLDQQTYQKVEWAIDETLKFYNGESKKSGWGVAYKWMQALSSTFGIPISNAVRDIAAGWRNVTGYDFTLNTKAQKERYINRLYNAMRNDDKKTETSIRQKLRAEASMSPKDIDTEIAEKLSYDERIAKAWTAKKESRVGDVNRTKNALAKEGFTGEMVDRAITVYGNRVEPKEKKEKDMDAQLKVKLYTYDDAMAAINAGASIADIKAMMSDLIDESDAKNPEKAVRDELKGKIKKEYMAAYKKNDKARMNELKIVLTEAVEMSEEDIQKWIKDQHADDLRSAVDNYDSKAAKAAVVQMRKDGKEDGDIKGSLDKYRELYIGAMNSGDRQTAQKIKNMLMSLGLKSKKGKPLYTNETFTDWMKKKK